MPSKIARARAQAKGKGPAEERRAYERIPADVEVLCRPLGASRTESWHGHLQNISTGGVDLLVERRFEAGTMLAIDPAASAQGRARRLMARVMHVGAQSSGEWRLGVELLRELTPEELGAWGADASRTETPDGRCESARALSKGDRTALLAGQDAVNGRECCPESAPPQESVAEGGESSPGPQVRGFLADPDLTCVCSTWAAQPAHVREAILVLVRGSQAHPDARAAAHFPVGV